MIDKKNNTNKGPIFEKSLTSFGRWFCGLDPKPSGLKNYSFSTEEQRFSVRKAALNSSTSELKHSRRIASRNNDSKRWYQSLGQSFTSWCAHDWLRPLPGLSVLSAEPFTPSTHSTNTHSTKGAFYQYGSDFLRYKQERVTRNKCGRIALFLAGTASGRAFNNASYTSPNLSSVTTLGSSLSSRMGNHAYQPLSQRWALDDSIESWSNTLQFSTAIAVAIPIAISTVQVMSSLSTPTQDRVTDRDVIAPNTLDAKPKAVKPTVAVPVPVPLQKSKPTGRIANVQSYVLPAKGEFSSKFGWRWGRMHRGVDIAGPVGTPIVAAAAGKVISAGWNYDGFGNRVEILHPDGTVTLYAHTNKVLTKVGKHVRQGELIAEMGSTGNSTGPHLHFQVHPKGKEAIDPMSFIGKQLNTLEKSPTI